MCVFACVCVCVCGGGSMCVNVIGGEREVGMSEQIWVVSIFSHRDIHAPFGYRVWKMTLHTAVRVWISIPLLGCMAAASHGTPDSIEKITSGNPQNRGIFAA